MRSMPSPIESAPDVRSSFFFAVRVQHVCQDDGDQAGKRHRVEGYDVTTVQQVPDNFVAFGISVFAILGSSK